MIYVQIRRVLVLRRRNITLPPNDLLQLSGRKIQTVSNLRICTVKKATIKEVKENNKFKITAVHEIKTVSPIRNLPTLNWRVNFIDVQPVAVLSMRTAWQ